MENWSIILQWIGSATGLALLLLASVIIAAYTDRQRNVYRSLYMAKILINLQTLPEGKLIYLLAIVSSREHKQAIHQELNRRYAEEKKKMAPRSGNSGTGNNNHPPLHPGTNFRLV